MSNRPVVWGCKIDQAPPSVTYEEAMTNDDRGLFKWLSNIVCLIKLTVDGICSNFSSASRTDLDFVSSMVYHPPHRLRRSFQIG